MITFETKCYENDWQIMLKTDYLKIMIDRCNCHFYKKVLFINNVQNLDLVCMEAEKAKALKIIDDYYIVSDYAGRALNFFGISEDSFSGGYYYSIAELVSIFLAETKYLLHFSSDSVMIPTKIPWVEDAIQEMSLHNKIIVANPLWNWKLDEAKYEGYSENNNWILGQGFSDQCYLIPVSVFKNQIYNEKNVISERYPIYGGELFEKRVDAYMRNNDLFRITSKHCSYIHNNIPKVSFEEQKKWMEGLLRK